MVTSAHLLSQLLTVHCSYLSAMKIAKFIALLTLTCFAGHEGFKITPSAKSDPKSQPSKEKESLSCGKYHCRDRAVAVASALIQDEPDPVSKRSKLNNIILAPLRFGGFIIGGIKNTIKGFIHRAIISPIKQLNRAVRDIKPTKHERIVVANFTDSNFSPPNWKFSAITYFPTSRELSSSFLSDYIRLIRRGGESIYVTIKILARDMRQMLNEFVWDTKRSFDALSSDFMRGPFIKQINATIIFAEIVFDVYFIVFLLSLLFFFVAGTYLSLPVIRYMVICYDPKEDAVDTASRAKDPVMVSIDPANLSATSFTKLEVVYEEANDHRTGLGGNGSEERKEEFDENDEFGDYNDFRGSGSMSASMDVLDMFPLAASTDSINGNGTNIEHTVWVEEHATEKLSNLGVGSLQGSPPSEVKEAAIPAVNEDGSFLVKTLFETISNSPDSVTSTQVSPSFTPTRPVTKKEFCCVQPFDENGVIAYLTSPIKTVGKKINVVRAKMSTIFMGSESTIIAHSSHDLGLSSIPNYTRNEVKSWCAIDLGTGRRLVTTQYCIRHGASSTGNALRSWELRAREKDTDRWDVLKVHTNDDKLSENPFSVAFWDVDPLIIPDDLNPSRVGGIAKGYRYFLLLQTGPNSSGNNCLFIGGVELYGSLVERHPALPVLPPENS